MEAMTDEAIEQQHCTMGDVHPMRACIIIRWSRPKARSEKSRKKAKSQRAHCNTLQQQKAVRCTRRGSSEFEQE